MGNIVSSSLLGKEETLGIDDEREDSSSQEGEGYDDVRYDGPLDLDQIIFFHSLHRIPLSEGRTKLEKRTDHSDDATLSGQLESSKDIQDETDATDSTSVLERTAIPSVSTEENAILLTEGSCPRERGRGLVVADEPQSATAYASSREGPTTNLPLSWEIDVTDFAEHKDLKRNKFTKGVAKKVKNKDVLLTTGPREGLYVSPTVTVTTAMLAERKVLDQRRWWFRRLNNHYGTQGKSYHLYKPVGKARTVGRTSGEARRLLKAGLHDAGTTFIYHCWNHYFCPVGFEDVPKKATDAFRGPLSEDEVDTWILVADPSRKQPGLHCFRWEDISTDLNCKSPECLNIRKLHLGVQTRKTKKVGGNLHCLMAFKRSSYPQSASVTLGKLDGRLISREKGGEMGREGGWVSRIGGLDEVHQARGCDEAQEVQGMPGLCEVDESEIGTSFKIEGGEAKGEVQIGGSEAGNEEFRTGGRSEVLPEAIRPNTSDKVPNRHWVVRNTMDEDEVNKRFPLEERTDDDDIDDEHTDSSE